jgi:polyvinyl alcohol dehydrogenase (cytochrome)
MVGLSEDWHNRVMALPALCAARRPAAAVTLLVALLLCLPNAEAAEAGSQPRCASAAFDLAGPQWNGWSRDPDNARYQPAAGLSPAELPRLRVKWAFGYGGAPALTQPSVVGGRLFVADMAGRVYSLDAATGCLYWRIEAGAAVRAAIAVGQLPPIGYPRAAAYFGDIKAIVHAVDAATGAPLWQTRIEEHPRARITGAPVLYRGRLYVPLSSGEEGAGMEPDYPCCSFRGSVVALDARDGRIVWKSYAIAEAPRPFKRRDDGKWLYGPAGAAIWSAPTIDPASGLLYVGTGNSYTDRATEGSDAVVAFDLATGARRWSVQLTPGDNFLAFCGVPAGEVGTPGAGNCPKPVGPDVDFGSSNVLATLPDGRRVLLAGQKSGMVYALDPTNGRLFWKRNLAEAPDAGGIQWGLAADERRLYAALRSGRIAALDIRDGAMVWSREAPPADCAGQNRECAAGFSAALTALPGILLAGSLDGRLRAYVSADGSPVWDFATDGNYRTTDGLEAKGGGIDVGGAVAAGGMLYVNVGNGPADRGRATVLLALSPQAR